MFEQEREHMTRNTLEPPAPPIRRRPIEIPIGLTGASIILDPDGGGRIAYRDSGEEPVAALPMTAAQIETFSYTLANELGATR